MAGAPSLLSPHSRSHWLGWWTWLEGIRRHAPLDWAELMSQKIPQPGLQGSPWASGETGSWGTGGWRGGGVRCVSSGEFWSSSKGTGGSGEFCGRTDEDSKRGKVQRACECDGMRQGLFRFDPQTMSVPGILGDLCAQPGALCSSSWCQPPHQAAPKVWNVPPILFLHAPSHSGPTAGRTGKGTERQREGCGKPNRSQAADIGPLSAVAEGLSRSKSHTSVCVRQRSTLIGAAR